MATQSADHPQLYPFSTADSESIPLEIIRPTGVITVKFTSGGEVPISFGDTMQLAAFYSPEGCFLQFGDTLIAPVLSGAHYEDTLFVPPGVIITSVIVKKSARAISYIGGGSLIVQGIYKWASLALPIQQQRR